MAIAAAFGGCAPLQRTPAERRKADRDNWISVVQKFVTVEEDLTAAETSYDEHDLRMTSTYIASGLTVASQAREVASQTRWPSVSQPLTAAADAITRTVNDLEAGVAEGNPSKMTDAYNDYQTYARNAIAATREARAEYVKEGGYAADILDFYRQGNGGESNAPIFQQYAHMLQGKGRQ